MKLRVMLGLPVLGLPLLLAACTTKLPEPESPAAQLYGSRCATCHRLYAPQVLKADMWKIQIERMQGEMARRGVKPLSENEHALLLDYLQRHAGK